MSNLKVKALIIVAVILVCVYGIIGIPKSTAGADGQLEDRISAWAWI